MLELKRHRAFAAHVAAYLKNACRTSATVRTLLSVMVSTMMAHAADPVAFVGFPRSARFQVAGGLVDVRLMVSAGMLAALALSTARRRRGLMFMSAAAGARGDHDFTNHPGPDLTAFSSCALYGAEYLPITVSSHGDSFDLNNAPPAILLLLLPPLAFHV